MGLVLTDISRTHASPYLFIICLDYVLRSTKSEEMASSGLRKEAKGTLQKNHRRRLR